jgi:hypothetical protein
MASGAEPDAQDMGLAPVGMIFLPSVPESGTHPGSSHGRGTSLMVTSNCPTEALLLTDRLSF